MGKGVWVGGGGFMTSFYRGQKITIGTHFVLFPCSPEMGFGFVDVHHEVIENPFTRLPVVRVEEDDSFRRNESGLTRPEPLHRDPQTRSV